MARRMSFYLHKQLKNEIENVQGRTFLHGGDQALAELRYGGAGAQTCTLAVDALNSVLRTSRRSDAVDRVYAAYGNAVLDEGSGLGFNGERYQRLTKTYALGQGYRFYSPNLMRFLAPDSLSPFGQGGLNSYVYCSGDPVNRMDPDGHADFSQMRRVARGLRSQAQALEARQAGRMTAQQRVEALRQRLRQRQAAVPDAQLTRNPLARPGGQHVYGQRGVGNTVASPDPGRRRHAGAVHLQAPPGPAAIGAEEAARLYEELLTAHRHEQRFNQSQPYLARGNEVTEEYRAVIDRIRGHADDIRRQLGVDRLSWFHF